MRFFLDGNFELNKIEAQIIRYFYRFRILSTEQVLFLIYPELVTDTFPINPKDDPEWRKSYATKYSRIRKELVRLEKFNFIHSQVYKMPARKKLALFHPQRGNVKHRKGSSEYRSELH